MVFVDYLQDINNLWNEIDAIKKHFDNNTQHFENNQKILILRNLPF